MCCGEGMPSLRLSRCSLAFHPASARCGARVSRLWARSSAIGHCPIPPARLLARASVHPGPVPVMMRTIPSTISVMSSMSIGGMVLLSAARPRLNGRARVSASPSVGVFHDAISGLPGVLFRDHSPTNPARAFATRRGGERENHTRLRPLPGCCASVGRRDC